MLKANVESQNELIYNHTVPLSPFLTAPTTTHDKTPDWKLTYVIVGSVHGVLLQAVPHDVPAHEGVRRSLDVLLIVVLL